MRFDQGLRELLPKARRERGGALSFNGPQSVKHLIESLGVPHTEVGRLIVNGSPSGLHYLVRDGDRIEVFSGPEHIETKEPRFAIDGHLGRLTAGLRLLGLDCDYSRDISDDELAEGALQSSRFILTRDRHLLMRKAISQGYLVRALDPRAQLREVVARFGLQAWFQPFHRCMRCNGLLRPVAKEAVLDRIQPLTRLYFDDFRVCSSCNQVYWKGSHFSRLQKTVAALTPLDSDGA